MKKKQTRLRSFTELTQCVSYAQAPWKRFMKPQDIQSVEQNKDEYSHRDEIHYLIEKSAHGALTEAERIMLHEWTEAGGCETKIESLKHIGAEIKAWQLRQREFQIQYEFGMLQEIAFMSDMKRSEMITWLAERHSLGVTTIRKIVNKEKGVVELGKQA